MPLLAIPSLATPRMETRLMTLNLIVGTNGSRLVVRVEQTGKHRDQETKWFPFFLFGAFAESGGLIVGQLLVGSSSGRCLRLKTSPTLCRIFRIYPLLGCT